jgi:uncharacterized protein YndB with AHSA1/START domain
MSDRTVTAARRVPAPPEEVFAFLADLENHWALASDWVEVRALDRDGDGRAVGGRVRLHGPAGLRRTARTRLLELDPPTRVAGTAEVGRRTRARVAWQLEPSDGGTLVHLTAAIERLGAFDRFLWAVAGRRVMRRGFPLVIARLESVLASTDSDSVAAWPNPSTSCTTTPRVPRPVAGPSTTPSSSADC